MCFFLSLHLSGVRRECVGVYWCAMPSATVSFSPRPLGAAKVRNVQMQHMGALICCNCSIHCVFRQTDGHLSSLTVLLY